MAGRVLQFPLSFPALSRVRLRHDESARTLWIRMVHEGRPCFSHGMLDDLRRSYGILGQVNGRNPGGLGDVPVRYAVFASEHPDVFNYGGDLALFREMIAAGRRDTLMDYAVKCIDLVHAVSVNCDLPMTTIALVQGEALGGGFEAALANSVIVAERRARFGLPEILFNLFPGMGAYHLLARRLPMREVEAMLTSGEVYTAERLHSMGVVDVLAEDGEGERAVEGFIREHARRGNARRAIGRVREEVFPVSRDSLVRTAELWVETALALRPADLRMIDRLVRAQSGKGSESRARDASEEAGSGPTA